MIQYYCIIYGRVYIHSGMSEEHLVALSHHCRVCGSPFRNKKGPQGCRRSCLDIKVALLEVFGIDINEDVEAIHPQLYCPPCNNIIYHTFKKARNRREYNPMKVIATWSAHNDINCSVCSSESTRKVSRRPRKQLQASVRTWQTGKNLTVTA